MYDVIPKISVTLFILVYGYTATSKMLSPETFISALQHAALLAPYRYMLAWLIPLVEGVIVLLLFIPKLRVTALSLATGLILAFTSYIFFQLLSQQPLPCSCGGIISQLNWTGHAILNTFLLFLGVWSIYLLKYYRDKQEMPNT